MASLTLIYPNIGLKVPTVCSVSIKRACGTKEPPKKDNPRDRQFSIGSLKFFVAKVETKKLMLKQSNVRINELIINKNEPVWLKVFLFKQKQIQQKSPNNKGQ